MSESNNKSFPGFVKNLLKADYSSDGAGDVYHVPEGVLHFARQSAKYKDIVIFNEPGRIPVLR